MRKREVDPKGFKPKQYPANRKSREARYYDWVGRPIGIVCKIMVGMWFTENNHEVVWNRQFTGRGIGPQATFDYMTMRLPELASDYFEVTGVRMTPRHVWMRGHNQFYHNGQDYGKRESWSNEHYTRSDSLIPYVDAVQVIYIRGEKITKAQCDMLIARVNEDRDAKGLPRQGTGQKRKTVII